MSIATFCYQLFLVMILGGGVAFILEILSWGFPFRLSARVLKFLTMSGPSLAIILERSSQTVGNERRPVLAMLDWFFTWPWRWAIRFLAVFLIIADSFKKD